MADFAFRSNDPDEDVAAGSLSASAIKKHMKSHGHDAHVEHGYAEHRVWIQHPKHEDTFAYVTKEHADNPQKEPYWDRK